MSSSIGGGAAAYRDPQSFKSQAYRCGKKSDIFSLGVVLWEISSQKTPCEDCTYSYQIVNQRQNGYRDPPVPGTPKAYIKLYSECWSENPDRRPTAKQVYERLETLLNHVDDTHLSFFYKLFENARLKAFVNTLKSRHYQSYLILDRIATVFEKILKPNYYSVYHRLDQIKNTGSVTLTEFLESKPYLCLLYNILKSTLKSDDPINSLYDALSEIRNEGAKELVKIVESNSSLHCLYSVGMTVVELVAKARALVSF